VLFRREIIDGIAAGTVTVTYRRWTKPAVRPGATVRTIAGILGIDKVERTSLAAIKPADAHKAGYESRAALLADIARHEGDLYRITFHRIGADPLIALRKQAKFTKKEVKSVIAALNRLDQSSPHGAWTRSILRLIDKYPARRAPDLAASLGRDPMIFQHDVRKLKELGLTESLEVGYRLSPRGRVVLVELAGP
jgi:hypothetical protein